jgi:hypothetical protein
VCPSLLVATELTDSSLGSRPEAISQVEILPYMLSGSPRIRVPRTGLRPLREWATSRKPALSEAEGDLQPFVAICATNCGTLALPKTSVPHPFDFLLSKGWEATELILSAHSFSITGPLPSSSDRRLPAGGCGGCRGCRGCRGWRGGRVPGVPRPNLLGRVRSLCAHTTAGSRLQSHSVSHRCAELARAHSSTRAARQASSAETGAGDLPISASRTPA